MKECKIADVKFSAIVKAPIEAIDLPEWCFSLSDREFQRISPAHIAAGFTIAPDGKRMSINVEKIGESVVIQHYVETRREKHQLILESVSDLFTPTGRTTSLVTWELKVERINHERCELTNWVRWFATEKMRSFCAQRGISFERFRAQTERDSTEHHLSETASFAASIERAAERNR